jgi:Tfp pilus assembly protein PilF
MKYKLRYLWSLAFASILASGCASSQPWSWSSMNPLAWGKPSSTKVGTFPDVNKQKYEGLAKSNPPPAANLKPGPAAAAAPATGLAATWQKTTETLSAPFKPKVHTDDAVSLSNTPPKVGAEVYLSTGRMHEVKGDFAGAAQQYERALQVAPNDLNALVSLARLYDRQDKYDAAIQTYQRAANAHPKSPLVHNDLGLCFARHQQFDKSAQELQLATQLQPQNAMYRNNFATVLLEQGRERDAFQQLAAVNQPAAAHYNLAFMLHQRGNNDAAAVHLREALAIDNSFAAAGQLLATIQPSTQLARQPQSGVPAMPASYPQR